MPLTIISGSLFFFLAILCVSEWLLITRVVPEDAFYKQLELFNTSASADIVAFGDSHMSQGFDAPEGALNLGLAGESFGQINIKLRRYLESHAKPKMIILQISPQMFADYRFTDARRDYEAFFGGKKSLQNRAYIFDPNLRSKLLRYWAMFLTGEDFISRGTFTDRGSLLIDHVMDNRFSDGDWLEIQARIEQHTAPDNFRELGLDTAISELVGYIKGQSIEICLVSFPVTPAYRNISARYPVFEQIFTMFEEIAESHSVPYFNYWAAMDDYAYFRNQDHLNARGAEVFSARLMRDCLAIGINSAK